MIAECLARRVLWHVKVYRMCSIHRIVPDPITGAMERSIRRERRWVFCHSYERVLIWATVTHDPEHVHHWHWSLHGNCRFDFECSVCFGHMCLCDKLAGPGMRDDHGE
jgi:hypothetical protein